MAFDPRCTRCGAPCFSEVEIDMLFCNRCADKMKANAAFNVTDRVDRALVVGDIDAALTPDAGGR